MRKVIPASEQIICDRCDVEVWKSGMGNRTRSILTVREQVANLVSGGTDVNVQELDLCPACTQALRDFLANRL